MSKEQLPLWLTSVLTVFATLGGKEIINNYLSRKQKEKEEKRAHEVEVEKSDRDISNKVLLDMIEELKTDRNEQKAIEETLRNQLLSEVEEKVKYQTRLEMFLEHFEDAKNG